MGGASRNEKKRKQLEAQARLRSAGITPPEKPNRTPLIVVAVVLAVAVVAGLAIWYVRANEPVEPTYAATQAGAVITAGSGGPAIDVYTDYLCPNCERFEERYGDELTTALNEGRVTARFHAIAILDPRTTPPGYATRAANAALCAVPAGIFPRYHDKLFADQPAEGSAGLTDDQLIAFGTELGAQGDFAGCVRGGANAAAVKGETDTAVADPALLTNGNFGTPTVAVNGQKVDLNDTAWLEKAIG